MCLDAGVGEAILIGSLVSAGAGLVGQTLLRPHPPGVPSPGANPGGVPTANQAALDTTEVRRRALQRRTLDSLRIDPASTGVGIQVPGL